MKATTEAHTLQVKRDSLHTSCSDLPGAKFRSQPSPAGSQAAWGKNIQNQDKPRSVPQKKIKNQQTSHQEFRYHVKHWMKWEPCKHAAAQDSSSQSQKKACTNEVVGVHRLDPELPRSPAQLSSGVASSTLHHMCDFRSWKQELKPPS